MTSINITAEANSEQLDPFFHQLSDPIVLMEKSGKIIDINDSFTNHFGWSCVEAITFLFSDLSSHSSDIDSKNPFLIKRGNFSHKDGHDIFIKIKTYQSTKEDHLILLLQPEKDAPFEKTYTELLSQSPKPTLIVIDERIIYYNAAARRLLELEDDHQTPEMWEWIDPSLKPALKKRLRDCLHSKATPLMEQKWKKANGTFIDVEAASIPIIFKNRQAVQIFLEPRQKEPSVNEPKYHEMYFLLNEEGKILQESSPHIHKEAIALVQIMNKGDREAFEKVMQKALNTGETAQMTCSMTWPANCSAKSSVHFFPFSVKPNEKRLLIAVRTNIQKHIQTKPLIEDRYRLILDHTYDLICVIDRKGNYQFASASYKKLMGLEPHNLIGKPVSTTIYIEDQEFTKEMMNKMFVSKDPVITRYRKIHKDGSILLFEGKGMPVLNEAGEVESIVFISQDIGERKKTEELMVRTEKLSVIGELAAGVAHEIRNPLTSIKGFLKLFAAKYQDKDDQMYHEVLHSELLSIEQIVQEFLVLAKPESNKLMKINLISIMNDTLFLFKTRAALPHIKILSDYMENDVLSVCGQGSQLKQVFINILDNAKEAIKDEGTIKVSISKKDTCCKIAIEDNGIGIPADRMKYLGEPFFTNKEKGIGLGLTISNKIIHDHKGKIEIESEEQKGTIVTICLPLAE